MPPAFARFAIAIIVAALVLVFAAWWGHGAPSAPPLASSAPLESTAQGKVPLQRVFASLVPRADLAPFLVPLIRQRARLVFQCVRPILPPTPHPPPLPPHSSVLLPSPLTSTPPSSHVSHFAGLVQPRWRVSLHALRCGEVRHRLDGEFGGLLFELPPRHKLKRLRRRHARRLRAVSPRSVREPQWH